MHLKGAAGNDIMRDRALKRGMIDPGTLLMRKLDNEKRNIALFEQRQRELHCGPRERLQIGQGQDREEEMDELDGEGVVPRQLRRLDLEEYIHYEEEVD